MGALIVENTLELAGDVSRLAKCFIAADEMHGARDLVPPAPFQQNRVGLYAIPNR